MLQDLRTALRLYAATPLVAAVAVLSLGLGIGSTTAIFSLINSVYLRPLAVDDPSALVAVQGPTPLGRAGRAVAERLRETPGAFERSAAYAETQFDISSDNAAQWVDGLWVSGSFFATMGVRPFAGRLLSEPDDAPGGDGASAVISHRLWQRRFAGAADAIGRTIDVNGVPVRIVGIAPPDFFGPNVGRSFDVAIPYAAADVLLSESMPRPGAEIVARLRNGQTIGAANAALQAVFADNPAAAAFVTDLRVVPAATGRSPMRSEYLKPLVMLIVLGGIVLLVACANVANLMLAWATVRRHELNVRLALGASSWRVVRQCAIESLLLAAVSTVVGSLVAFGATRLLLRELAAQDALTAGQAGFGSARLVLDVSLDGRVLAFTAALAIVTALLFGIAPALRSLRAAPADALKDARHLAARSGTASLSRFGVVNIGAAGWILVGQVALSLTLAVSAGLFVRSFTQLSNVELGLDASRALIVNVRHAGIEGAAARVADEEILAAVRALPGVAAAALSLGSPPISAGAYEMIAVEGAEPAADPQSTANLVSPEWFAALGMRSVAGRLLTADDTRGAPHVAVVNEAFVRTFLGGANPLGRSISSFESPVEIVGVVRDVVSGFLRDAPAPAVYLPLAQADGRLGDLYDILVADQGVMVTVRSATSDPSTLTPGIVDAVRRVSAETTLTFRYLYDQIEALTTRERVLSMLSAFFGGLALLLAALGLYGIVAHAVARQRREIAIRIALGARPHGVVASVVARMLALIGVGVLAGAVLSLWGGRFIAALLYGIAPSDAPVFVGAALLLALGGAAVAWLPARHAARIDPASVLRYE